MRHPAVALLCHSGLMFEVTSAAANFRVFQCVHDLCQFAARSSDATLCSILSKVSSDPDPLILRRLIGESRCRFSSPHEDELHATIVKAASPADEDPGAFHCATAILLAGEIQGGGKAVPLQECWDAHRAHYLQAPQAVRAVLMAGFDAAAELGRVTLVDRPPEADFPSRAEISVLPGLCKFAQALTQEEIGRVAGALHGRDADQHRLALEWVLRDPDCRMPERSRRHPAEVLSIVAGSPGAPGFPEATAVLLADAIRTGDAHGEAAAGWSGHASVYCALPKPARDVLLAGFRLLYEKHRDWSPYPDWSPQDLADRAIAIPLPRP